MSNFTSVIKYLDLDRSSKDETINTKPLTLDRSRAIKKVQDTVTIPAHFYTFAQLPANYVGRMLFQYNVTVGYPFSFVVEPMHLANRVFGGSMFIKWREGNTVYRYRINAGGAIAVVQQFGQPNTQLFSWFGTNNDYTNQFVGSNCCFEFWLANVTPFFAFIGLKEPLTIRLTKLRNPSDPDDLGISVGNISGVLQIADLGVNLPEALPYNQANQAWLTN